MTTDYTYGACRIARAHVAFETIGASLALDQVGERRLIIEIRTP
jgi:hypothetical protein